MEEFLRIRRITAGIAQADAALGLGRVLEFHDAVQEPVRGQQHAAIGARIRRLERQQGQARARLGLQAFGNHLAGDQRHVAIDDQQGAGKIRQRLFGAQAAAWPVPSC